METIERIKNNLEYIYQYAEWLADHPVPCNDCIARQDSIICDGCELQLEWIAERAKKKKELAAIIGNDLMSDHRVQKMIQLQRDWIVLDFQKEEIEENIEKCRSELKAIKESFEKE